MTSNPKKGLQIKQRQQFRKHPECAFPVSSDAKHAVHLAVISGRLPGQKTILNKTVCQCSSPSITVSFQTKLCHAQGVSGAHKGKVYSPLGMCSPLAATRKVYAALFTHHKWDGGLCHTHSPRAASTKRLEWGQQQVCGGGGSGVVLATHPTAVNPGGGTGTQIVTSPYSQSLLKLVG